ncbi:MAG: FIVAR domain-containing protein, partial [Lachnospiraceae bacterium]|nr:FIVAR domain-containing protein [Lachnospiraceae bacterium]
LEGVTDWSAPATTSGFDSIGLTNSQITIGETATEIWNAITKLQMTDDSTLNLEIKPTSNVDVVVNKSGASFNLATPLITAPADADNVFTLSSPVTYTLAYNQAANETTWTLAEATELPFGVHTNEEGTVMDIDLKLPKTYTPVSENATAYETYLAKVQDLTNAGSGKEVPVVEPIEVKGEIAIYVDDANGSDDNKGTLEAPFKTIQKALSCVETLQTSEEPFKGIVVYLKGGTYNTTESINITSAHSGKDQIPVIISAYDNEEVVISGGTKIAGSKFKPVNEISAEAYNKLSVAIRDEIVAVSLTELGISTDGAATTADGANYQVFVDGEELTLSRYPNATNLALTGKVEHIGYINFSGDSMGNKGDNADDPDIRFEMTDLRPTLWDNDGNIWLKGSLYAEWLIQNIRVKDINTTTGIITMDGGTDRGAKTNPNNTYYYYNVLEELDVPGEFYLDTEAGILYMYPISDMSTATVTYSDMQQNIINLAQTKSVVLNGLTIECGANYGINMTGCKETLIQNCTLRNLKYGVRIAGEQSGIIYSEIYKTMNYPVLIGKEGSRDFDYTPEENFLQNCYIHTTGNPNSGNVRVCGTGNVVSHNLFQNMNNSSIYLAYVKECIIEYNEITGGPTGVFDMGAIYAPHDIRATGTHVRYNYIHDIGINSQDWNPNSIYFDEGLRENYAYGNIMENVPSGFLTNSGSEHVVIHNIIANGREATLTSIRGSDNFKDYTIVERNERTSNVFMSAYEQYLALSDAKKAEVKGRYPLLVKLFDEVTTAEESGSDGVGLFASQGSYIHENLIYNHGTINFTDSNDVGDDNIITTSNPFTNVDAHDFTLTDSSIAWADKLPSMDRIGILTDSTNTKEPISEFDMYAPSNGNQKVDPFNVLLKWSVAGGADDYVVKISKNSDMSDARTIETIKRNYYFDNDEFFVYDTTYYWTVTARTVAESRIADSVEANNGAVYSFKTMTRDEYLAANPLDTTALEETIAEAETLLAEVSDISAGGLYEDGTYAMLDAAITAAQTVLDTPEEQDQISVNQAKAVLAEAIRTAQLNRSIQYVTFEELRAEDWASVTSRELLVSVEADELKITRDASLSSGLGQTMYTPGLGIRDILCFQYKIDSRTSWHGFVLAQANENAYAITNSTDGYFICINTNQVELQKRQNGNKVGQIDKALDTTLFDGGEYYDIEIGAINYPDGSVGIHFKIGDTLIFDPEIMRDTTADVAINDADILTTSTMTAIVGEPFVDTPTFGTVLNRKNGPEYLKLSAADYTALEAELAQADSLTQSDYTTDSWNAYQAMLDEAEALATNLAAAEQASVDEMTAKVKAAREALVAAASPTAKPEIIVEGTVTSYSKGSNATVSVHCTGELKNLTGVKMDNREVDAANYTVKEGSTIVTFKTEYLETLSAGEHTVTLLYADGSSVDSKLTILAAASDDTDDTQDDDTSGEDSNDEEAADSTESTPAEASGPSTGDNSNLILWFMLMVVTIVLCGFIGLKNRKTKQ